MSDIAPKKPAKPTTPGTGTVFDVKRPGKVPVQGTSRPLIVGHQSVVRDPITTGRTDPISHTDRKPDAQVLSRMGEVPGSHPNPPQKDTAASPELAAAAAELAWQAETEKTQTSDSTKLKPEPPTAPGAPGNTPKDFGPESIAPEPEKKQIPLSPELRKKMEEEVGENPTPPDPQGVVVSGSTGPMNFMKVLLWFVSVIILVIIIGDVLLDTGAVTTSVDIPHTHFIK